MDNASKALIMAGAILISVAIVGIGIYIFSTANALTDDAVGQIDSLAVSSVNSRLEMYCSSSSGDIRGSQVLQLVNEINAMNANNTMPTPVGISGTGISGSASPYTTTSALKNNGRYTVTPTYSPSTGYITSITVK